MPNAKKAVGLIFPISKKQVTFPDQQLLGDIKCITPVLILKMFEKSLPPMKWPFG